ncbi:MAG: penicillin-binding protein 2 [Chloroflexota bacterium]|jgi:penicillin-binding protein 2
MSRIGWERIEELELQEQEDPRLNGRLYFLRFLIIIVLTILLYRVYWIQQDRGAELQLQAEDNQFAVLRYNAPRGTIVDRNGQSLAINQPSFNVTITPALLPGTAAERQGVYERLSLLTGVPVTNTVQQEMLNSSANPELVSSYTRMARIYGAPVERTLDEAGLVPMLPDSIEAIVDRNSFAQYVPAVITTGVPITLAQLIEQESIYLPGVRVIPGPLRDYPAGEYTAHLIGYMGPIPNERWLELPGREYQRNDRVGWSGLENSMEIEMAGQKGRRVIEQNWALREVRQIGVMEEPVPGLNLHLTLDLDLQKITHEILGQFMIANRTYPRIDDITGERTYPEIEQAVVVALNPQTGEVLAMVNYPTFDNNRFQTEVPVEYYLGLARNEYTPLVNHAVSGTYPPGSVFKMVPGLAALQDGLISANRFLVAPGEITIANRFAPNDPGRAQTFYCWDRNGHGLVNMLLGIAMSCDIYFYKIAGGFAQDGEFVDGVGVQGIYNYAFQFGFGRVQGIELPLEAPGNLPTAEWKSRTYGEPWSTGDDYNLGIGQGYITSTPLQLAQMTAVIANGGFLYRPTIIHHMTDDAGNVVFVDDRREVILRARPGPNGEAIVTDADGNPVDDPSLNIRFDEAGDYIYQPQVIDALDVEREHMQIIQDGMRRVNVLVDQDEFYTGATWVDWLDNFGLNVAGKTGTSEYCDNIAITRGWCRYEDIAERRILPTHSFYVGYAPFENPEIAVATFIFNGGEGSAWAAPVSCNVIAAYFGLGQYASIMAGESGGGGTQRVPAPGTPAEEIACNSLTYIPDWRRYSLSLPFEELSINRTDRLPLPP